MTTRRLPTRYHRALALEPRILLDAAATATAETVIAATDTKPGVTAKGVSATVSVSETDGRQSVDLFSDVSVSADGSNQELSTLVISVNSSGSNQALVIDGTTISLTAGRGATTDNRYGYTVTVSGSTTTITLALNASDAISTANVASLIDGISYTTLDNSVTSRNVTVSLESLSDTSDTATLGIKSTIAVTSTINVAPELSSDKGLSAAETFSIDALGNASEVLYSSDGRYAYVAGEGGISVFSVDSLGRLTLTQTLSDNSELGSISHMVISSDGKSIYTQSGNEQINLLSVGSDGKLTYVAGYNTENGEATGSLAISQDGAYVYVGTQWNGLVIYSRDATTGALSVIGRAPQDGNRNAIVTTSGNYVYALYTTGDHTLYVYSRNSDGTLNTVAEYITEGFGYSPVDYGLVTSADGQSIYLADPDSGTLQVYQFSGSSLNLLTSVSLSGISDLALSTDGRTLYASTSAGTINVYSVTSSGTLSQISSFTGTSSATDLALASDGLSLLVGGSSVSRYTAIQDMVTGQPLSFASGLSLSDSNYDVLANGAGNYNGASISISADVANGTFGLAGTNGLSLSNGTISLGSTNIATLTTSGTTVTVAFTADVSTAVANQVLNQLTYSNSQATPGNLIRLTVTSRDSQLSSNTQEVVLRVSTAPQVNSEAADTYTLGTATSETVYNAVLPANLFSDADGDNLTWSVTGLPAGLSFDAATRTIQGSTTALGSFTLIISATDAGGHEASLTRELVVGQIENRAPLASDTASKTLPVATQDTPYSTTLDRALFSDPDSTYGDSLSWSVSNLPDGLSFDANTLTITGTSPVSEVGSHTITVKVTDASGLSTETTLTLRVIDHAEADNKAPVINIEPRDLSYTSDGKLSGFTDFVNSIKLSDDGSTLVIAASTANNGNGTSYLLVYARDTDTGALTLKQKFVQGTHDDGDSSNGIEVDGLNGATSVAWSADGKHLYLSGYTATGSTTAYSLSVFSVDTDSSNLSLIGSIGGINEKVVGLQVADNGKTIYALSANTLYAYSIADNGLLTAAGTYGNNFNTAVAFQVDNAGTVYVLSSGRMTFYTGDSDGKLTFAGQVIRNGSTLTFTDSQGVASSVATLSNSNAFNGNNSLAVSDDGHVYLVTSNGFLTTLHYDRTSNALSLTAAIDAYTPLSQYPQAIVLSADGTTLYVTSGANTKMAVYAIDTDGTATLSKVVNISGGATRLAISADGKSIYAGTNIYSNPSLSLVSASGAQAPYLEHSAANVAAKLSITDAEYDALANGNGDYKDAVITLVRAAGASSEDTYGFSNGNGLTLSGGVISLDGNPIATFSSTDGALSVTFDASVSKQVANQVLQQITYTNTSSTPGSSITLKLSVKDTYVTTSTDLQLNVTEVNDAPTLSTTPATTRYTEKGDPVSLFSATRVSTVEAGQNILGLTLSVAGVSNGSSEVLYIDGTEIALVAGSGYTNTGQYSVALDNGVATITFTSFGMSHSEAQTLIDGVTYANTSQDPTAGTRTITLVSLQDNGGTDNGGSDTRSLNESASVEVIAVNDPPQVSSSATDIRFVSGSNAVSPFSDATVSTVEAGQSITQLTFTVAGLHDGNQEALNLGGTRIALVAGNGTTPSGYSYSVTLADSVATVTLSGSGMSAAEAATLIDNLSYANSSQDPTLGVRTITLATLQDSGGSETTTANIAAQVEVVLPNQAPILSADTSQSNYSAGANAVPLFSNTLISAVEGEQQIAALTFSIRGVLDSNEVLNIDGAAVSLRDGVSVTSSSGLAIRVSVADGNVNVSVTSSAGLTPQAAQSLVNTLSYDNGSPTVSVGVRSVSVVAVQDNGGIADGGQDTTALNITASVTVLNSAPTVSEAPATLSPARVGEAYSAVLPGDWFNDVNGDNLSWSVEGLPQGLAFDAASRTITGTVSAQGSHTLTITVTDPTGATALRTVSLAVDRTAVQPVLLNDAARDRADSFVLNRPLADPPGLGEPVFDPAPETGPLILPGSQPLVAAAVGPDREARWSRDASLANASNTITQQLVQADALHSDSTTAPISGDFVVDGATLVSRLAPATDGERSATLTLPAQLPDGTTPARVTLASGLPLPNWVRFDSRTGQLQVDRAQLTRLGSLRLAVSGRDIDGSTRRTEVILQSEQASAPEPQRSTENRQSTAPDLPTQLRQSSANSLLDDARALLESLSGLDTPNTAPARHTA